MKIYLALTACIILVGCTSASIQDDTFLDCKAYSTKDHINAIVDCVGSREGCVLTTQDYIFMERYKRHCTNVKN